MEHSEKALFEATCELLEAMTGEAVTVRNEGFTAPGGEVPFRAAAGGRSGHGPSRSEAVAALARELLLYGPVGRQMALAS